MNVQRLAALVALATLSLTRATSAAPATGIAAMHFFDGAWTCKRTANPDRTIVGTQIAFYAAPSGQSVIESFGDGRITISYAAATQRYVFHYLGSNGMHEVLTSPGWVHGTVQLTGAPESGGHPATATFTRHGAAVFTASYLASGARYDTICAKR